MSQSGRRPDLSEYTLSDQIDQRFRAIESAVDEQIDQRFRAIESKLDTLQTTVLQLAGNIAPRTEMAQELAKRVSQEAYQIAHQALQGEVNDLERDFHEFRLRTSNSWQRAAPWVAIGCGLVSMGITSLLGLASLAVSIIALTHV